MVQLSFEKKFFVCRCDFASREIPRKAGFRFSVKKKVWFTESLGSAVQLRQYANPSARKQLDRVMIHVWPWSERLTLPQGLKLKDFQEQKAIPFVLSRNKSYAGLEQGLGKTIVAAVALNSIKAQTVVLVPPGLAFNTKAEFRKWSSWNGKRPTIRIYDPKENIIQRSQILIVADSLIHRVETQSAICDHIKGCESPVLVVDEVHRYCHFTSSRTKALFGGQDSGLGIIEDFTQQIYLSGTPMPNRPIELYPILSRVAPETIGYRTFHEYGMYFCDGKFDGFDYDYSGASHLDELEKNVKAKFMLRLYKKDVLKELPPVTTEVVIIGERPPELVKLELSLLRKYSIEDLVADQVSSEHLSTYRKELGEIKLKSAVDFVRSLLDDTNESILVFGFHKKVIEQLASELEKFKPLVISGKVSKKDRHQAVKIFQEDPSRRVMIANYVAAGVGLTLTKATHVVHVEYDWVPAVNDQARDRTHRIGQTKPVFEWYLVYENSLDGKVLEVNLNKRKITGYI